MSGGKAMNAVVLTAIAWIFFFSFFRAEDKNQGLSHATQALCQRFMILDIPQRHGLLAGCQ
jgi:hypothetical protein